MGYVSSILILTLSLLVLPQIHAQPESVKVQRQRQSKPYTPNTKPYPQPKPIDERTEAERVEAEDAIRDANTDVEVYNAGKWGAGSFLASACCPVGGGVIVMSMARSQIPTLPAKRLLGKSPVYTHQYAQTYITGIQEKRRKSAMYSCVLGSAVGGACLLYIANEVVKVVKTVTAIAAGISLLGAL